MLQKFIAKDIKRRKQTINKEITKKITKYLLYNDQSDSSLKTNMKLLRNLFTPKGNRSKIVNRCIVTGRNRGIVKQFKISRITFKKFVTKGLLHGVNKSSW
jgi:small subunit ribosomal protein S14